MLLVTLPLGLLESAEADFCIESLSTSKRKTVPKETSCPRPVTLSWNLGELSGVGVIITGKCAGYCPLGKCLVDGINVRGLFGEFYGGRVRHSRFRMRRRKRTPWLEY